MSKLEVDAIEPQSGTTLTIGDSGDTINLVGTLQSNGSPLPGDISSVVAGTGLSGGGTSGDVTLNIDSAQPTITSTGTLTGFTSTGIDDNATSTALTIDSSERVGIGTSSPGTALEVVGTGVNGIELGQQSDGNDSSRLFFTNSSNVSAIRSSGGSLKFSTGATINSSSGDDRVIIHSNGVMSAANGIALGVGANNTASNVLDDYEEGTWTPNIGGNATYSAQAGHYRKIGKMVFANFQIQINVKGTGYGSKLAGLPFNSSSNSAVNVQSGYTSYFANLNTAVNSLAFYVERGAGTAEFVATTSTTTTVTNGANVFADNAHIYGAVVYATDA